MGSFSIWHWLIVLVIVLLIFGTKKLRNIGADLGGAVKVGVGTIDLGELGKIKVNTDVEGAMGITAKGAFDDTPATWKPGGILVMRSPWLIQTG